MQRSGWTLLLIVAVLILGAPAAVGSRPLSPPGSDYRWAQPGTASVATPRAQPPAWILSGVTGALRPVESTSAYAWAQPGTAAVLTPDAQPPAWVPIG